MSQTDVDTQVEEQLDQNTNTDNDVDTTNSQKDSSEVNTQESNETQNDEATTGNESENDSSANEPTTEQLDALSDEEFVEYMNSGKLPERLSKPSKSEKVTDKAETEEAKSDEDSKPTPDKARVISKPDPSDTTEDKAKTTESTTIDYEDAYKRIFAPFKANGKEITPRTVEDVISLMQMGANYTKKMQAMAPMRKIIESLNNANVTEDDLNFLIDIHKGDKEAIKQLLKKNEVDLAELDLEEVKYKPNKKNIASDEDVSFAETLSDINDSLPKIQEILNNKWDAESKKFLLSDPAAMRALHEEIQMGRFDKVQQRLEIEKTFGRYNGVPDLQAYIDLLHKVLQEEQASKPEPKKETPKPTKPVPDKRKAAPTRVNNTKGSSSLTAKDLFSMSDEEFDKLSIKDLV